MLSSFSTSLGDVILNSQSLRDVLIEILADQTTCIAREINDRAYSQYDVPFTSFRNLRIVRDGLVKRGIVGEILRDRPYGKPCKFYYLTATNGSKVDRMIENKHKLLLEYSEHTTEIGHFGEDLVAEVADRLGFTDIKVRMRLGKEDIDVWCRDRSGNFNWAIQVKNRRQEIDKDDIDDTMDKAKKAASKWNIEFFKPAIVSSSIYNRLPESPFPIIRTGEVYAPNEEFYRLYKDSLGLWFMETINSVPNDLLELIDKLLK